MPSAVIDQIATAVTATIAGASLSQSFTPVRKYLPRKSLETLASGQAFVSVVGRSVSFTGLTRSGLMGDYVVEIGVQAKVEDDEPETIEPWTYLTEEIATLLAQGTKYELADGGSAVLLAPQIEPIYLPEHLDELKVFTSVIRLTFKAKR